MDPVLHLDGVTRRYLDSAGRSRTVLDGVTATLGARRAVAVVGPSGSGKSTLLNLVAGIDVPTEGRVLILGRDVGTLDERARTLLRRDVIGLVFQFFHLLPHLSVRENVLLPAMIAGDRTSAAGERAAALLDRVGLADRASDPVAQLSGGELQRVALCRALLRRPKLLLADEPTGNLDDATSRQVMPLLLELVAVEGASLLFVTHNQELAALSDERWELREGRLSPA
jgi:ABC-type lipoprotein export system ATPase subunit